MFRVVSAQAPFFFKSSVSARSKWDLTVRINVVLNADEVLMMTVIMDTIEYIVHRRVVVYVWYVFRRAISPAYADGEFQ